MKNCDKFTSQPTADNIHWVAKEIAATITEEDFCKLQETFIKLDAILYKSWAKEMQFNDLKQAIDMVANFSKLQ